MIQKRYKKIYKPDHPHAMSCGCVYEHRLIMEGLIGRYLLPEEQVHHKDENKRNNHPDNLVLCANQKEHSGEHQKSESQLIDLLVRYADVYGRLPYRDECDGHPELPHSSTYVRRFGSWSAAKRNAQHHIDLTNMEETYS